MIPALAAIKSARMKWMIAHTPNLPPVFEGLRKAGLLEE
jgi:hypothetical protein